MEKINKATIIRELIIERIHELEETIKKEPSCLMEEKWWKERREKINSLKEIYQNPCS